MDADTIIRRLRTAHERAQGKGDQGAFDVWNVVGELLVEADAEPNVTHEVKGRVTLADGSTSDFIVERGTGYQQWGASTERLGRTVDLMQAMAEAVAEHFPDDDTGDEDDPHARLEYLRAELRAERISYGELAELESLREHIAPGDVELREAAGFPEFDEDQDA